MPEVSDYTTLLSGGSWHGGDNSAAPSFVTYSFETEVQSSLPDGTFNNAALNSMRKLSLSEQAAARHGHGRPSRWF